MIIDGVSIGIRFCVTEMETAYLAYSVVNNSEC